MKRRGGEGFRLEVGWGFRLEVGGGLGGLGVLEDEEGEVFVWGFW